MCLSPIWTEKHETARRLSQRIKIVLDIAKSRGFRSGENPVTAIKDAQVLPKVKAKPKHHMAMRWQDVPAFYADLSTKSAMSATALMFTCLTGARTGEVLGVRWEELDLETRLWICPAERMKTGEEHRVRGVEWVTINDRILYDWQVYARRYDQKTVQAHLVSIRV